MFGEITNAKLLGGWTFKLERADKLPQELASAFTALYGTKLGGAYKPLYYVGTQVVNGTNHMLIVERTMLVSGGKEVKDFAVVVINIPAGDFKAEAATKVSETDAADFVIRDDIEKGVKRALTEFTGANHKPILELGEQVVKGINYHFICESKGVYPNAEPYLTRVAVNNFENNWTIDEIERL